MLTVFLESKPRRDTILATVAAMAVLLKTPGFETQRKAAHKLKLTECSISRALTRLRSLLSANAEIEAIRLELMNNHKAHLEENANSCAWVENENL
jgi:hypothetical protein